MKEKLPPPSALIYTIPGKPTPIICKASLTAAMLMKKCRFYSLLRQSFSAKATKDGGYGGQALRQASFFALNGGASQGRRDQEFTRQVKGHLHPN